MTLLCQAVRHPIVLLVMLGALCACRDNKTPSAAVNSSEVIRSATLSLPKDLSPTGVFTTNSSSLVIKAAADARHRSLYSWEPGKAPKLIFEGGNLDVIRLSGDTFAAWYSQNNQEAIVTLNAQGLIAQPLMLPQGGPTGWGACEGDPRNIVCIGDPPGMGAEDKDYDEMGFSAVLVIDLGQRKTSWFPVKHQTYFHFDPARERIYVSDLAGPSLSSPVEFFNLAGNVGGASVSDMTLSRSGRFTESLQEDGSEFWAIRDSTSKKVLLAFNCDKPECKPGDRYEDHYWNPVFDGQVVALNLGGAYGKGGTCDVYQCSPPRLVKRIPCDGLPVYDWSRDGRELITISYEGGKFHREPVN